MTEHYGLVRTVSPSNNPVEIGEAKLWCKIEDSVMEDDSIIQSLIQATADRCERVTGKALITQTWRLSLDAFPADDVILVPKPPLQSVVVDYVNTAGTLTTLASTEYDVDTDSQPGRVMPAYGKSWPTTRDMPRAVRVTFVAGYGLAPDYIPFDVRTAMLGAIVYQYDNRGDNQDNRIIHDREEFMNNLFRGLWSGAY